MIAEISKEVVSSLSEAAFNPPTLPKLPNFATTGKNRKHRKTVARRIPSILYVHIFSFIAITRKQIQQRSPNSQQWRTQCHFDLNKIVRERRRARTQPILNQINSYQSLTTLFIERCCRRCHRMP